MKTDVNLPLKKEQKNFFLASWNPPIKKQDPDPETKYESRSVIPVVPNRGSGFHFLEWFFKSKMNLQARYGTWLRNCAPNANR